MVNFERARQFAECPIHAESPIDVNVALEQCRQRQVVTYTDHARNCGYSRSAATNPSGSISTHCLDPCAVILTEPIHAYTRNARTVDPRSTCTVSVHTNTQVATNALYADPIGRTA